MRNVADERILVVFDNDNIRLTSIPALLVQRLRWLGHAARRLDGELIKDPHRLARGADELGAS